MVVWAALVAFTEILTVVMNGGFDFPGSSVGLRGTSRQHRKTAPHRSNGQSRQLHTDLYAVIAVQSGYARRIIAVAS